MNTIVIGGTGTIGRAVARDLEGDHEVVRVGHSSGEERVDMASRDSLEELYDRVAPFEAVICAAGRASFGTLSELEDAGVEAFARAAALELDRGLRVNVVSPPWVAETLEEMGRDPSEGMPAAEVARAYRRAVEGEMNGQVLDAREFA